jgi:hypothetical protein
MRQHWKGITIASILMLVLLAGCTPLTSRPHTYRAAVMDMLDKRAIRYLDVQVHGGTAMNAYARTFRRNGSAMLVVLLLVLPCSAAFGQSAPPAGRCAHA